MSFKSALAAQAASRMLVAVAVGALCIAGASAGAATLLTGSPSPSVWISTYQRSAECHQVQAAQDPRCSVAAAQAAAELRLAASLESKAKALAAQQAASAAANQPTTSAPDPAPPLAAPPAPAVHHSEDDSSGGHDD